jgi:filamentous hemagglutinin
MDQVKTDEHGDEKRAADNQFVVGSKVGAGGALQLAAGINETAALTVSSSALAATGALSLNSTGNVVIGGVQEIHVLDNASKSASSSIFTKKSSNSTDYIASSTLVGSSVTAGTVSVKSGNDILITGSALTAQKELALVAGHDIVVASGQQVVDERHSAESKRSGFSLSPKDGIGFSKAQQQQNGTASSTTQLGSTISGGSVTAVAGRDLFIVASNVVADNAVVLAAARDGYIVSAQSTTDSSSASESKQSGLIGAAW